MAFLNKKFCQRLYNSETAASFEKTLKLLTSEMGVREAKDTQSARDFVNIVLESDKEMESGIYSEAEIEKRLQNRLNRRKTTDNKLFEDSTTPIKLTETMMKNIISIAKDELYVKSDGKLVLYDERKHSSNELRKIYNKNGKETGDLLAPLNVELMVARIDMTIKYLKFKNFDLGILPDLKNDIDDFNKGRIK